jgi:hypothetical protein
MDLIKPRSSKEFCIIRHTQYVNGGILRYTWCGHVASFREMAFDNLGYAIDELERKHFNKLQPCTKCLRRVSEFILEFV